MINEQDHHHQQQQQQNGNHLVDQLMKPIQSKSFGDYLIEELYRNNLHLNQYYSDLIRIKLNEYDQFNMRRFEEKDQFINQLKQNLMELTEKRFRQLNAKSSPSSETLTSSHSSSSLIIDSTNALNNNMKFVLNEKDAQISQLLKQLNENELEIDRLKTTIKEQDNIILSHNNNIYELKNNNETVLKAKQESFRLMNDDMQRKQKLIDDQTSVIKNLKEKIEQIEEQHAQSRSDLEKRLNEKENDLLTKIATFESNLLEGRHYFEDILKEKQNELNQLKQQLQLQKNNDNNNEQHLVTNSSTTPNNNNNNNENNSLSTIQKYDAENLKNIKSLYEHQIDLLKVKIDMLEKTCNNYKKGMIFSLLKGFKRTKKCENLYKTSNFLMQKLFN